MSILTTSYQIPPLTKKFDAQVTLPGSKSIALRQLAISALVDGKTILSGIPECDDIDAMIECLGTLGVRIQRTKNELEISGPIDLSDKTVSINTRMSGASTRILIGLAALRKGLTRIDGHESLRKRTNEPLLKTLEQMGCIVKREGVGLPVEIRGPVISPELEIAGNISSQYVTALLLISPFLNQEESVAIKIKGDLVSKPYIDITVNEMRKRGLRVRWNGSRDLAVGSGAYSDGEYSIEGDATAASYFSALATIHNSSVNFPNLGSNTVQGDYFFFEVMEQLGAKVERTEQSTRVSGSIQLEGLSDLDMNNHPDVALTLIAMSPVIPGTTTISGLSSLHHKECDRLDCPAAEFEIMGVPFRKTDASITIDEIATGSLKPHTLCTYHDHRMAMAFSVLASKTGNITIDDKKVVDKTYPNYWSDYQSLSQG